MRTLELGLNLYFYDRGEALSFLVTDDQITLKLCQVKLYDVVYWLKILRKFWDQQNLHTEQASFHILITSYQLIIQDCKYFSRINWHYMVLDEAQALKSSSR